MAVMKRITAQVGTSKPGGLKTSSDRETICPHCQRQTTPVPRGGRLVCALCLKGIQG